MCFLMKPGSATSSLSFLASHLHCPLIFEQLFCRIGVVQSTMMRDSRGRGHDKFILSTRVKCHWSDIGSPDIDPLISNYHFVIMESRSFQCLVQAMFCDLVATCLSHLLRPRVNRSTCTLVECHSNTHPPTRARLRRGQQASSLEEYEL